MKTALIKIKKKCHIINLKLSRSNLQFQNFGNVSQRLDDQHFIIKPSGVNLNKTKYKDYPVISIKDNKIVEGKLKPSSDTPTHSEIYKLNKNIKGITHAHSLYATIWAQSEKKIPLLGTTHADYWKNDILVTKKLSNKEISNNYEKNTGLAIKKVFKKKYKILENPGVLIANHGAFCWGTNAEESFLNFERLEFIAELSYKTLRINQKSKMSKNLADKHFTRKHGPKSYYGQK